LEEAQLGFFSFFTFRGRKKLSKQQSRTNSTKKSKALFFNDLTFFLFFLSTEGSVQMFVCLFVSNLEKMLLSQ